LSVDADYSRNAFSNSTRYVNEFYNGVGSTLKPSNTYRNITPAVINIQSFKADYVHPLSATMKIEAGMKSSTVRTDNNLQFDELEKGEWNNNSKRSNHFIYDETIHAAYLNTNKQFKKTSVQFGLRAENTISRGNSITENKVVERKYIDLFPSLFVNQAMGKAHSVSLSYSRRIDRPDYNALNPFVYYVDEYTFQKGNPFLHPQYSHAF